MFSCNEKKTGNCGTVLALSYFCCTDHFSEYAENQKFPKISKAFQHGSHKFSSSETAFVCAIKLCMS